MKYKFKTKPYAHQMTALEKSWNKKVFALFMEMGTGKTKVAIDDDYLRDIFISKLDKNSNTEWSKLIGSNDNDYAEDIEITHLN